jgi:membrane protease YdiL (CAAX protease family)
MTFTSVRVSGEECSAKAPAPRQSSARFALLRTRLALAMLAALAAVGAFLIVQEEGPPGPVATTSLLVLAIAPLIFAVLALAHPAARRWLAARGSAAPVLVSALPAAGLVLASIAAGHVDPYFLPVAVLGILAVLLALGEGTPGRPTLSWTDVLCFLALWVPFDLHAWTRELWPGPSGLSYPFWALTVSLVAVAGFGGRRDLPGLGFRLPEPRDAAIGLVALVAFGAIALPLGYASRLLRAAPTLAHFGAGKAVAATLGIALTVALPEEILFRGVLDNGLLALVKRPWLALGLSSVAFGLTHWNNEKTLGGKVAYCVLASVAGVFYGLACRRSKGLPAAVLVHTLVDATWLVFLKG